MGSFGVVGISDITPDPLTFYTTLMFPLIGDLLVSNIPSDNSSKEKPYDPVYRKWTITY